MVRSSFHCRSAHQTRAVEWGEMCVAVAGHAVGAAAVPYHAVSGCSRAAGGYAKRTSRPGQTLAEPRAGAADANANANARRQAGR